MGVVAFGEVDMATGGVGIGVVGGEAQCSIVVRQRPVGIALGVIGETPEVVGIGHIGVELQGLTTIGDGGIEFAAVLQSLTPIGIGPSHHRGRIAGSGDDSTAGL